MTSRSFTTKINLTAVKALAPDTTIRDTDLRGFEVRKQGDRQPVYSVRARLNGRRIRITIGSHGPMTPHTARLEATKIIGFLASGIDPRRPRASASFGDVATKFLEHIAGRRRPGTLREYSGHLRTHLARYNGLPMTAITEDDLNDLHLSLQDRPVLANRVLATVSSLYGWAASKRLCAKDFNPASFVEKFVEQGKERFLNLDEIARVMHTIADLEEEGRLSPFALAAIKLLLLTGCRRDEIRTARWADVDFNLRLLNLANAKAGKRSVHLNSAAIEILEALRNAPGSRQNQYIVAGAKPNKPHANLQDVWVEVRKRAGLDDVRIHDLRHSVASLAGSLGTSLPIIGSVLGHRSLAATKRYVHLAGDPAKLAAEKLGELIANGSRYD